jgi:hypothetical protein
MTTIAWDGKTVAADKLGVAGHVRQAGFFTKLIRVADTVYGFTGTWAYFGPMVEWHLAGADPAKLPVGPNEDDTTTLIVFKDGRCFTYDHKVPYPDEHFAPAAWGTGADFAITILAANGIPIQAVEVASMLDVFSGNGVDVIDLTKPTVQEQPMEQSSGEADKQAA